MNILIFSPFREPPHNNQWHFSSLSCEHMGWSICAKRDALNCVPFPKDLVHLLHLDCVCKKCWISIQKSVFFLFLFLVFKYCSGEAQCGERTVWIMKIEHSHHITILCTQQIQIINEFLAKCVFALLSRNSIWNWQNPGKTYDWVCESFRFLRKRNVWHSGTLRRILHVKM